MNKFYIIVVTLSFFTAAGQAQTPKTWIIDTQTQWSQAHDSSTNIVIADGFAEPNQPIASFQSILKTFSDKKQAKTITFTQSPVWDNWTEIPAIAPWYTGGAPVFLPITDKDYWFFAKKDKKYHAWHSTDLKNWDYCGLASTSPWVTDAEYVPDSNSSSTDISSGDKPKGKFYIYYDKPNDEDPHLAIASYSDLINGIPAKEYGMAFKDLSHGSDCGIFRNDDGTWHMFYEDWTPINARKHSWDSPLAGRTESPDGIHGFAPHIYPDDRQNSKYLKCPPPIDQRTTPTGEIGTYKHGGNTYKYEVHQPDQDAYGDYSMIKVGSQYYLFSDFHPIGKKIRVGRWTSSDIRKPFNFIGQLGENIHPDPSIGFAEGKFYLVVEEPEDKDFLSPGPWVDSVEIRIGIDTDNDKTIDTWTPWQTISEKYSQKPGFAKIVNVEPAQLDLTSLPQGYGFKFEFKTNDTTDNNSKPIIDKITMSFQ